MEKKTWRRKHGAMKYSNKHDTITPTNIPLLEFDTSSIILDLDDNSTITKTLQVTGLPHYDEFCFIII